MPGGGSDPSRTLVAQQSAIKFMTMDLSNLVTPKAATELDILYNIIFYHIYLKYTLHILLKKLTIDKICDENNNIFI